MGSCSALVSASDAEFPAMDLLAIGTAEEVGSHPALASQASPVEIHAQDRVLIPGLVNAHTHLDLTHIGPRPFPSGRTFLDWVDTIRAERPSDPVHIAASVREGAARSLAGGVVAVGDIAGVFGIDAYRALSQTRLIGICGIEVFGLGNRQDRVIEMLGGLTEQAEMIRLQAKGMNWTWQPHAPYSVGLRVYHDCARRCGHRGVPMMTHLAETPEERQIVATGDGLQRDWLERIGVWDETCAKDFGRGASPVGHLREILAGCPTIAAHVNCASDEDIRTLESTHTTVAYCPRASVYFRQEEVFGPHRYREMLDAGINVVLGTDSVINLPEAQADRLSTLDEARLLVSRDGLDAETALGMATWRGGVALGLDRSGFSLSPDGLPRHLYGLSLVKIDAAGSLPSEKAIALSLMASEHPAVLVRQSG